MTAPVGVMAEIECDFDADVDGFVKSLAACFHN